MEKYSIENDGAKDFSFTGERIAGISSSPDQAHPWYSGSTGRWKKLRLYRTQAGKYICQEIGCTQWQGEKERNRAAVCETEQGVIEFFGLSDLAKELYKDAGIGYSVEIE